MQFSLPKDSGCGGWAALLGTGGLVEHRTSCSRTTRLWLRTSREGLRGMQECPSSIADVAGAFQKLSCKSESPRLGSSPHCELMRWPSASHLPSLFPTCNRGVSLTCPGGGLSGCQPENASEAAFPTFDCHTYTPTCGVSEEDPASHSASILLLQKEVGDGIVSFLLRDLQRGPSLLQSLPGETGRGSGLAEGTIRGDSGRSMPKFDPSV